MTMDLQTIFIQIVVVLINIYLARTENIRHIFVVTFLFNFANLVMYISNGDRATVIVYIIICLRSFTTIFRDKLDQNKIIPVFFILLHLIVGLTAIENVWQLLPALIPCYTCYYLWFYDSTQKIRIGNMIANGVWFIYNTKTGLYIVAVSRFITVVNNAVAYIQNRRMKEMSVQGAEWIAGQEGEKHESDN